MCSSDLVCIQLTTVKAAINILDALLEFNFVVTNGTHDIRILHLFDEQASSVALQYYKTVSFSIRKLY